MYEMKNWTWLAQRQNGTIVCNRHHQEEMTTFVPVCSVLTAMERTRSSQFEIANDLFSDLWGEKKTTVIYFKWKTNKKNVCLK